MAVDPNAVYLAILLEVYPQGLVDFLPARLKPSDARNVDGPRGIAASVAGAVLVLNMAAETRVQAAPRSRIWTLFRRAVSIRDTGGLRVTYREEHTGTVSRRSRSDTPNGLARRGPCRWVFGHNGVLVKISERVAPPAFFWPPVSWGVANALDRAGLLRRRRAVS